MLFVYFILMKRFSIGPLSFSLYGEFSNKILDPLKLWPWTHSDFSWNIRFNAPPIPLEFLSSVSQRGDTWYYEDPLRHGFLLPLFFCLVCTQQKEIVVWPTSNAHNEIILCEIIKHAVSVASIILGGFLFHSSGVYKKTIGAFLFFGGSGAGKSTIHSLLKTTWTPLHEEFNLVYPYKNEWWVSTTPLSGTGSFFTCDPSSLQINSCYRLVKGLHNNSFPMRFNKAYTQVTKEVVIQPSTNILCTQLLKNTELFTKAIPVSQLTFLKNEDFHIYFESKTTGENI